MYQLMCKDDIRAEFYVYGLEVIASCLTIRGKLPIGYSENVKGLTEWLKSRFVALDRHYRQRKIAIDNDLTKFAKRVSLTHFVSLMDCFWVKDVEEEISWKDVNPYTHEFNRMASECFLNGNHGFNYEPYTVIPEFSTDGDSPKCWQRGTEDAIYLVKSGYSYNDNSGLLPPSEVLASQIFTAMKSGIPYYLEQPGNSVVSKCKLFTSEDVSFAPYRVVYDQRNWLLGQLNFYHNIDAFEDYARMCVCDAVTFNVDRHVGNHGVLYDSMTGDIFGFSPSYDYNGCMLSVLRTKDLSVYEYKIQELKPRVGDNFVNLGRSFLSDSIREDLQNLKGIELSLPFYTEHFTERRVKWLTDIVNTQIDIILGSGKAYYPPVCLDGLSSKYRKELEEKAKQDAQLNKFEELLNSKVIPNDLMERSRL